MPKNSMLYRKITGALLTILFSQAAITDSLHIAAASNFKPALSRIISLYALREDTSTPVVSYASTGKLASQLIHGARYDIFISADSISNPKIITYLQPASIETYAIGKLALWSASKVAPNSIDQIIATKINCIALANYKLAPYGLAGEEALRALNARGLQVQRVVKGQSIGQTFQFVASGSCDWGFVAYAQLIDSGQREAGLLVPEELYSPLLQNVALLKGAKQEANDFLLFLKSQQARDIIKHFGYDLPPNNLSTGNT